MARTNLTIVDVPLTLAVKKLSEMQGILIKLDKKALAAAGVALDAPVTTSIKNYTLRAALFHLLGNTDLEFELSDGVLAVTIASPRPPEAQPPVAARRLAVPLPRNAKNQPGFVLRMVQLQKGPAAIAQFNGVFNAVCMPVQDLDDAEDRLTVDGDAAPQRMRVTIQGQGRGSIEQLIFSSDRSATAVREHLLQRIEQEIDVVDRICNLSNEQKDKLRLAGRGDIKRLDRADAISTRIEKVSGIGNLVDFAKWAEELSAELEALRPILTSGSFDENSLFVKALKRTLTTEQAEKHKLAPVTVR